jgi:hypothetical protein
MEVLNALVSEADRRAVFSPLSDRIQHHASIYADDLVIFLSPNVQGFTNIQRILDLFAGAYGLVTNIDKCVIMPICCSPSQVDAMWQVFPCKV